MSKHDMSDSKHKNSDYQLLKQYFIFHKKVHDMSRHDMSWGNITVGHSRQYTPAIL